MEIKRIPRHVSIIMDGNGRWAKQRGKERIYGHFEGAESVRAALESLDREQAGFTAPAQGLILWDVRY